MDIVTYLQLAVIPFVTILVSVLKRTKLPVGANNAKLVVAIITVAIVTGAQYNAGEVNVTDIAVVAGVYSAAAVGVYEYAKKALDLFKGFFK